MSFNGRKLGTIKGLAAGESKGYKWNNANATAYHLNALPVVPNGAQGSAAISNVSYRIVGAPFERELHYTVSNTGKSTIDVDVWAFEWNYEGETWAIAAKTLHPNKVQETGGLSDGDEVYMAIPWLRSTPGRKGSTSSWYRDVTTEIEDVEPHVQRAIPSAIGTITVPRVRLRNLNEVQAGHMPELFVVVSLVFESDGTPFHIVNGMMRDVANAMQKQLAPVIEGLTLQTAPQTLASQFKKAVDTIVTSLTPGVGDAIGIWLASGGDVEEPVGHRVTLYVAAEDDLWNVIHPTLSAAAAGVDVRQLKHGLAFSNNFKYYNGKQLEIDYTIDYQVKRS